MEKQGIIKPGVTPPEVPGEAQKRAADLEDHPTKRAADAAASRMAGPATRPEDEKP